MPEEIRTTERTVTDSHRHRPLTAPISLQAGRTLRIEFDMDRNTRPCSVSSERLVLIHPPSVFYLASAPDVGGIYRWPHDIDAPR